MKVTRKSILIGGFALAGGLIVYGLVGSFFPDKTKYDFVVAERKTITQEVSVTGRVQPAQSVDLAFERGGKIALVSTRVNDQVVAGQVLVSIGSSELSAELSRSLAYVESARAGLLQYQAAVDREQARLDELKQGSREEEIRLAETRVLNAQKALEDARINVEQVTNKAAIDLVNAYDTIRDVLRDAYAKTDDAVSRQTDKLFYNGATNDPRLSFVILHRQIQLDTEYKRTLSVQALEKLKSLSTIQSTNLVQLGEALAESRRQLLIVTDFLQKANEAIIDSSGLTVAVVDSYRTSITTGLSNVNAALAAINAQEQKIAAQKITSQNSVAGAEAQVNTAESNLAAAQGELNLKRAGASGQELAAQAAAVKQAQANVASQQAQVRQALSSVAAIRAQLDGFSIRAPFNGIVTKQDAKPGEIIGANMPVVSVISDAKFEIEANVPEIDVAKIKVGNRATTTLDAYGNDAVFAASVITIDPAETIIEGVSTYKVKLQFEQEDERIKSGMTANVIIMAARQENALVIPQRAVIEQDGKKIIRLLRGEGRKQAVEEVTVKTGLRGSDGNVEILEGLQEGDKVVVGEKVK